MNQTEIKKSNLLFVGDLPKETTYEDLQILFKNYHFQFATLNNSKISNIWAQVSLENEEYANKARHELNGEILIPKLSQNLKGRPIRICKFEKKNSNKEKNINQSLLVKNIDSQMTQKEFYNIFLKFGEVESAKIEYDENGISKGFGYIYYSTENEAEEAKKNLNGKEFYGKSINIVNLVPSMSNSQGKNLNLFVINFPLNFCDDDLKKLFEKYGNVKYANVVKDNNGKSKGIGFITFSNFEETSKCISDIKINKISFQGLSPLCVKYASKKEDREKRANFTFQNYTHNEYKIKFNLIYSLSDIKNEYDLEKEIRLFIKVIMLQEYSPKDVTVNMELFSGIVTINKLKDYEYFMQKYNEFCMTREPEFECIPLSFDNKNQLKSNYINVNNNNFSQNISPSFPINNNQNYSNIQNRNSNIFPNMIFINNQEGLKNQKNNNFDYQNNNNYNNQSTPIISNRNINYNNNRRKNYTNNNNNKNQNNKNYKNRKQNNYAFQNRPIIGNFPNIQSMQTPISFPYPQERRNIFEKNINEKYEEIDQRNLQNLNPFQLQSQFKDPPVHMFSSEIIDSKEKEEISNEIADSIYEIVYEVHPVEAAKITGMIKEMGIEKMNMLLSKKDDLLDLIEKGYKMIKNEEAVHQ